MLGSLPFPEAPAHATGVAFETVCVLCSKEFERQDRFRVIWTGCDGQPYCSPEHALVQLAGSPE